MEIGSPDDTPTRLERLFDALLTRDGAGGSWLSALLRATPRGAQRLGELVDAPGWLEATVAVRTETGRRGAFEYRAAPSRRLLRWYIDHPDQLTRPAQAPATPESARLRRALIDDQPAGARSRAQERARELLRGAVPLAPVWWRFEESQRCECVLITDRLVLLVRDGDADADGDGQATPWLPRRRGRVRDLEAARRLAEPAKAWGVLTLTRGPEPASGPGPGPGSGGERSDLAELVDAGAPHLDAAERAALRDGDLGTLGWERAAAVTGLDLGALPGA